LRVKARSLEEFERVKEYRRKTMLTRFREYLKETGDVRENLREEVYGLR
jgi:hypothetical protein